MQHLSRDFIAKIQLTLISHIQGHIDIQCSISNYISVKNMGSVYTTSGAGDSRVQNCDQLVAIATEN